jgi:hypothetical protein
MLEQRRGKNCDGESAWGYVRHSSVGPQNEVDVEENWCVFADYVSRLFQILERLWAMSTVQEDTNGTHKYASSDHQTFAIQGVGLGFCWRNPPVVDKRAPVCVGHHWLLYQVGWSGATEEHDTPRGDQFHVGTYSVSVWYTADFDDGSRASIHVSPIQGACSVFGNQVTKFVAILCSSERASEASNKTMISLIKKKNEEKPRRWHEVLFEALWAYRTMRHGAIKVTPFELVYGQEAVLPVEINLQVYRVKHQEALSAEEYQDAMMDEIDEVHESWFKALREIEKEMLKVARAYNKRVREKSF